AIARTSDPTDALTVTQAIVRTSDPTDAPTMTQAIVRIDVTINNFKSVIFNHTPFDGHLANGVLS
ncbi:hypothetical protein, partial [Succinatimonas hippei]